MLDNTRFCDKCGKDNSQHSEQNDNESEPNEKSFIKSQSNKEEKKKKRGCLKVMLIGFWCIVYITTNIL
jgi:hypothetical protein